MGLSKFYMTASLYILFMRCIIILCVYMSKVTRIVVYGVGRHSSKPYITNIFLTCKFYAYIYFNNPFYTRRDSAFKISTHSITMYKKIFIHSLSELTTFL